MSSPSFSKWHLFLAVVPQICSLKQNQKECFKQDVKPKFFIREMIQRHSEENDVSKAYYILITLSLNRMCFKCHIQN